MDEGNRGSISIDELRPVSAAASAAYTAEIYAMTAQVDRRLADRSDVNALIGGCPLRVMFDNHRSHAHFISNVLQLGRFDLLLKTVPWVYRAYLNQGFDPTYFVVELEAWRAVIAAQLSEAHAAEILPVYAWIAAHHEHWIAAARVRPTTALAGLPAYQEAREAFFRALHAGDTREAMATGAAVVSGPALLVPFFEEVVRPALAEIGLRWEAGNLTPAKEHRATAIAMRVLSRLQAQLPVPAATRGRALVGAAPNEYHEVGAQMLALLLEQDGWDVSYLGADTPEEDFVGLACEVQPQLIALSVAMPYNVDRTAAVLARLRSSSAASAKIMLGGNAFAGMPEVGLALGPDAMPASLADAISVARAWSAP